MKRRHRYSQYQPNCQVILVKDYQDLEKGAVLTVITGEKKGKDKKIDVKHTLTRKEYTIPSKYLKK